MNLPEDLKAALEHWRAMDERLIAFRRLGDVLRVCAESYDRVAQNEQQVARLAATIADYETKREELDTLTANCQARRVELQRVTTEIQQAELRLQRLRERLRAAAEGALQSE